MKSIDRKTAPQAQSVEKIDFLSVSEHKLSNGIPVYLLKAGEQDVVKIDVIFEAGHWNCKNPLLADFTSRMLMEGSIQYTSAEIAEKFDYLGTFVNFECGKHFASVQLYCLAQYIEKSLDVFQSYIKFPVFPENEFVIHLKNEEQQYTLAKQKTEVLALETFYSKVFGQNHPYGLFRKQDDFENLTIEQLKQHHLRYYNPANCKIVVSGKLPSAIIEMLNNYLGKNDWQTGEKTDNKKYKLTKAESKKNLIKKEGAVQASIRLGKSLINKKHPDFQAVSILNVILGGYYGSRLMTNLRGKNALTYGVHSSVVSLLFSGVFSISANVNMDKVDLAIEQIINEVNILRHELVSDEELEMVKNYLSGEMLHAFDGALNVSEIYAGLLNYGLDFNYYKEYFQTLKAIDAETLRELAIKYLDPESFVQVVAGDF
ncbi:MAG: insulinase family protein [Chloroflexia bacterium]|nr:insulinase family protein [Chloroflexia bacterium]